MALRPTISMAPEFAARNAAAATQSGRERLAFRKSFDREIRLRESQPMRRVEIKYAATIASPKEFCRSFTIAK
jgi:hypothetical protein